MYCKINNIIYNIKALSMIQAIANLMKKKSEKNNSANFSTVVKHEIDEYNF